MSYTSLLNKYATHGETMRGDKTMTFGVVYSFESPAIKAGTQSYRTNNVRFYICEQDADEIEIFVREHGQGLRPTRTHMWEASNMSPTKEENWKAWVLDCIDYTWNEYQEALEEEIAN